MKLNLSSLTALTHHRGGGMNPERDWGVLLTFAIFLLVLIVGWHVWAFGTVVTGGTLGNSPSAPPPAKTSVLDTIPAYLEKRAAEEANYIHGTYRFADPSL